MPLGGFLNGAPVVQLRGIAWLALSETGQVGAGSVVSDGGGGGTTVWSYAGTIPCRVDPLAPDEGVNAGRMSDRSTHLITCPPETAVTASNRFSVAGRGTFEVTAVDWHTDELVRVVEAVQIF
jgi:hypothetical protein